MSTNKKEIVKMIKEHGYKDLKFISKTYDQIRGVFYCIQFLNKENQLRITYINTINNIDVNYSIEQFIHDHSRGDFIDVLQHDFDNNPAFDSIKLLTKLL